MAKRMKLSLTAMALTIGVTGAVMANAGQASDAISCDELRDQQGLTCLNTNQQVCCTNENGVDIKGPEEPVFD